MRYESAFGSHVVPACRDIDDNHVFNFNYYVWTLFYFVGLQFTHLDNGILSQFTLDWEVMKNWPPILWAVFFLLIGFVGFTFYYLFELYATVGIAFYYQILLVALIGGLVLYGYMNKGKYEFHFHHYCVGMFMLIMCCYQNMYMAAVYAIFNGVLIDGGARWGYDPIWNPVNPPAPTAKMQKTQQSI